MRKIFQSCVVLSALFFVNSAVAIPITLNNLGNSGNTTIFGADLSSLGLSVINSITIVDSNSGVGGSAGIFSGFDLDAIFLDMDGSLATAGDRFFASSFDFLAGTTRPTISSVLLPNAAHPGPTFGSLSATAIDFATATLNSLDANSVADVNSADGFLTLGDGGSLTAFFNPGVLITATLYLITGEVGLGQGEAIDAEVFVNEVSVPEPSSLMLLALGVLGLALSRRKVK